VVEGGIELSRAVVEGSIDFSRADESWTEHFNTVDILASVLEEHGHRVKREKTWLVHPASGFILIPQLFGFQSREDGRVQTATTIQTNHPVLTPHGIFEHQHGWGDNTADSIYKASEQSARVDFVPLLEALQPQPESCMTLNLSALGQEGKPKRVRRAVLGPVAHYVKRPSARPVRRAPTQRMRHSRAGKLKNIHSARAACSKTHSKPLKN